MFSFDFWNYTGDSKILSEDVVASCRAILSYHQHPRGSQPRQQPPPRLRIHLGSHITMLWGPQTLQLRAEMLLR